MKLIIQIPCFNEAEALPVTLAALPRTVEGFSRVEWLIVDDGSTDETVSVARANGVDHVVSLTHNSGLARAFMAGLDASLRLGADVIVNTDADNQYRADDIPTLVAPILAGRAEYVIGSRPITEVEHFSLVKKALQKLGSWAVRVASDTDIPDAPSGFRAITRHAALRLNVLNDYTYTLETIIQAGRADITITSVPVRVNEDMRPSRLVTSVGSYIRRSIGTIVRIFMTYRPMRFFMIPGIVSLTVGTALGVRFVYLFVVGRGQGHIQSLVLAAVLLIAGFQLVMTGFLADLFAVNRRLIEDVQWRTRRLELDMDRERGED